MATLTASRRRRRWIRRAKYGCLALLSLPWVFLPLWMLVINSFKTQAEASVPTLSLPTVWNAAENYQTVLVKGKYLTGLSNSLLIAIPAIALVLFLGSMAAWSYARSPHRSLRTAYYLSSLSMILPPAIIPTVWLLMQLGLNGERVGYFLVVLGTRLGVVVLLTTGFARALPTSLEEAAEIDGAGRWQIYFHIILPLLKPVLFTSAIMLSISVWNDFFFALFLLQGQSRATLPLMLYQFVSTSAGGGYGVNWQLVFANVVLTALPLLVAYVFLQRRVIGGLTEGGVTG